MKKVILTIVCLTALTGTMKAEEDYIPFVVEGKVWNTYRSHGPSMDYWFGKYYIEGDTVINDILCKKLYSYNVYYNDNKIRYEAALYEKDKKVHVFNKEGELAGKDVLLYDFNLRIGDSVKTANGVFCVMGTEKHDYRGIRQNYYVLCDVNEKNRNDMTIGFWREGVGTNKDVLDNYPGILLGGYTGLLSCVVNGDTIYSYTDNFKYEEALSKKYTTGISTVKAGAKARAESWYDLQGRPVTRPEKGRIYIHDGRKIVR